ncbi:MAG: hypothetical protein WCC76_15265 [Candidatus Acidiferrales bacterium]|jgi:hypothetical protein
MRIRLIFTTSLSFAILAFAPPSRAQDQQPAPAPAATSETSSAPSQLATKKVWTNDDFNGHAAPAPAPNAGKAPKTKPVKTKPVAGKNANWYRTQIGKLNNQVGGIDQQIASYQAALNGETPPNKGVQEYRMRRADWQAEIQKLGQQKQDLLGKISALEDEARHNGVEQNQLH